MLHAEAWKTALTHSGAAWLMRRRSGGIHHATLVSDAISDDRPFLHNHFPTACPGGVDQGGEARCWRRFSDRCEDIDLESPTDVTSFLPK